MIQTINISLIPSDNKPVINVSQFDNISRVLRFNVFDDAGMKTPHVFDNTETVLLNIRKNDNNIVVITGVIVSDIDPETQEVTGQYLTFELTEQACACVGSNYGEVSITSGNDEVIGSCNFKLIVERSPLAGGLTSQSAIDNLTTQIEEITEQVIGEDYYNKEEVNGLIDEVEEDIPTKTSQLQNDSGYITEDDIPTIPTKTSQLQNDSGYITEDDIPTIPTKTSQLQNDSGFTTIDDDATVNDKTWSSNKINNELINILPTGTASGAIANFNTSLAWPLEIEAEFGADVGGVSEVNLVKCGGNFWNEQWELGIYNNSTGEKQTYNLCIRNRNKIKVKGGTNYYIYLGSGNIQILKYDKNEQYLGYIPYMNKGIISLEDNVAYINFNMNTAYGTTYNNNISINQSSDTTYHEYITPTKTLINLDDTYYNGGKVTIDKDGHRKLTADGQTITLPDGESINALVGDNNVYCDTGDTTVQYKDTIANYIDTRVNTVSSRSLSMMRTLETLETIEPIERGDNNDENER